MEKYSVSRLLGAAPGYVGYEEGGQLTEPVRHNPYSIVLFDEIEKANPEVYNVLLQIMDDGRLTDSQGRVVDFKNTIIIMTSNLGSQEILEGHQELVDKLLRVHFKPEFLNRIDEIVYFNSLSKDVQYKVTNKMLNDLSRRLALEYYQVVFTKNVTDYVLENSYSLDFGARPIRRFIQHNIETILARMIISETLKVNTPYKVDYVNNQIVVNEIK